MTDREAMKLVLDFLESGMPSDLYGMDKEQHQTAITALRQALERPQTPDDLLRQSEREGWRYAKECEAEVKRLRQALEQPEGWREQFKEIVYDNLAAADNQDVPLEEYPDRILEVLDGAVGPRHPTVVLWRNDAIKTCMSIAYKYCRDPETYRYLKQDFEALITEAPQPQQIPEGYKLVPIEPTDAMLSVPVNIDLRECVTPGGVTGLDAVGLSRAWEAMIEAAPKWSEE